MTTSSRRPAGHGGVPPALTVRGLVKRRGAFTLGPVDLEVDAGATVAVLGPNGSGKTTLFGCLAGVFRPDAGHVEVAPPERRAAAAAATGIGYLADPPAFFDRWSGVRNLAFLERVCPTWSRTVAADLVERLDVDPTKPVRQLSKGNRAKLGIVAVLARRPHVVLLDEPTSGLDPLARRALWDAVAAHRARWGTTVVFASHDVVDVERNADVVWVLRAGDVIARTTPAALRAGGPAGSSFADTVVDTLSSARTARDRVPA
jgi:ABC-2 type transport system ATP-binding protein